MIRRQELTETELIDRLARNRQRLHAPYYQLPEVFQAPDASWPGDKEGRALLAFVSHVKATGHENPCMEAFLREMPRHTNESLYFGPDAGEIIFEQQLSGHSWLLRGLCEHYEQYHDEFSLRALVAITEGLYLPTAGRYHTYPVDREVKDEGGVSGHTAGQLNGWNLSSDIGCAFMSIDGLSHVYAITRDERVKALLDEMITVWCGIDKIALRAQTHCTLTSARGMLRLYEITGEPSYLEGAKGIYRLYAVGGGMDAVYQNLNWWGRPDTWTEPCAIVDSLMVAGELYRLTGQDAYRRTAARIFRNGLASAERPDGGAGTDSVVFRDTPGFADCPDLFLLTWEAPFCCTMRLAEGLWYAHKNRDIFYTETEESEDGHLLVERDEQGRYTSGDLVLAEPTLPDAAETDAWSLPAPAAVVDGHSLSPLQKYYEIPASVVNVLRQRVLF